MAYRIFSVLAVVAGSLIESSAQAAVYRGIRDFGGGLTGALTIETDGTIGILSAANIVDLRLRLSGLGEDAENYGDNPIINAGPFNPVVLLGTSLFATGNNLLFDFDNGGGTFGLVGGPYYVLYGAGCALCQSGSEFYELDPEFGNTVFQTGVQVLGSVPEPASWAMMIAGFGLVGAAMRQRRLAAPT